MRVGLTYDLRSEYLALGYSEDETAEFDRDETIEAIEASLRRLGHTTDRIGNALRLTEALAARRPLGPGLQHRRGHARHRPRGPGPGPARRLRHPLHLLRPAGHEPDPAQGHDQAGRPGRGHPDRRLLPGRAPRRRRRAALRPALFVKPVAEGTGKGITAKSVVRTRDELPERLRRPARDLPAAGAGRALPPRPRVHRRHRRHRRPGAGPRHDGGPAAVRGRTGRLLLPQQGKLRGTGPLPLHARRRRPADRGRRGRSRCAPGGCSAAATPAASTCAATAAGGRSSSRSTRSPGSTPSTRTCRSSARSPGSPSTD